MSDYFKRVYKGEPRPIGKVLGAVYPEMPFALLEKCLRRRDVFADGKRVAAGTVVSRGCTLDLFCTPAMVAVREVFRNEDILAVYKPKGVPTDGEYGFSSLIRYKYGQDMQLLHRLDTNTDGIVLFACNHQAYALLYEAMRTHRVFKYYRARVWGVYHAPVVLRGYLLKDAEAGRVRILDIPSMGAVEVACQVTPIAQEVETCTVDIMLKGGKTHQLRAQLAHDGHFILGDGKYGDDRINARMGYKRQQLTAYKVCFDMPDDPLGLNGVTIKLPEEWMAI